MPPRMPAIKVTRQKREASVLTVSMRPVPMDFPSRIAPAFAMPKQATVSRFLATTTTALAATISLPRCPMMTEYMENATPHTTSVPKAGRE